MDEVYVVTGAAGDIGRAIARRLLAGGARVAAGDLDMPALQQAFADDGCALPDGLLLGRCDVADNASIERFVADVVRRWGRIDGLVNNAAIATGSLPVCALDEADWSAALDVNLTGAWRMARAVMPQMLAAGRGVVLNMSSQLGHVGAAGRGAYGASKAGLLALTRAIAVDYASQGIRAVSLSPGAVLTGRVVRRYGSAEQASLTLAPRYPLGRLGTVAEVAEAACFLLGSGAAFMTGTDLLLDGGYTAV